MSEALKLWILQKYKIKRYGPPTWRMLLGAIAKIDEDLFKTLAKEHQGIYVAKYRHVHYNNISNSYSTGPGIYGSKRAESEGVARGQGSFTLP